MKILNRTGPCIGSCGIALITDHQLGFVPPVTSQWSEIENSQFSTHYPAHMWTASLWGSSGRQHQRLCWSPGRWCLQHSTRLTGLSSHCRRWSGCSSTTCPWWSRDELSVLQFCLGAWCLWRCLWSTLKHTCGWQDFLLTSPVLQRYLFWSADSHKSTCDSSTKYFA